MTVCVCVSACVCVRSCVRICTCARARARVAGRTVKHAVVATSHAPPDQPASQAHVATPPTPATWHSPFTHGGTHAAPAVHACMPAAVLRCVGVFVRACVCVCVCVRACVYVCAHVCISVYMCPCERARAGAPCLLLHVRVRTRSHRCVARRGSAGADGERLRDRADVRRVARAQVRLRATSAQDLTTSAPGLGRICAGT